LTKMVVLIEIRTLHDKFETAHRTSTLREKTSELIINDTQEWYSIISLERNARNTWTCDQRGMGMGETSLKELLGHVCTTALVDNVRDGKKDLEGNDQEDEEAHTRRRGSDS
jgi:hypothetical protein